MSEIAAPFLAAYHLQWGRCFGSSTVDSRFYGSRFYWSSRFLLIFKRLPNLSSLNKSFDFIDYFDFIDFFLLTKRSIKPKIDCMYICSCKRAPHRQKRTQWKRNIENDCLLAFWQECRYIFNFIAVFPFSPNQARLFLRLQPCRVKSARTFLIILN